MAPRQREMPADPDGRLIVKALDAITSIGVRQDQVFDDWLEVVEATLDMLPVHARSIAQFGRPAEDSPAAAEVWTRLNRRYKSHPWIWEKFSEAYGHLVNACRYPDYKDLLGQIYMAWGWPSKGAGQFFTPWDVAVMMARFTSDGGQAVHERLKAAITESPLAQAALVAGCALDGQEALDWYLTRVVPACIEHYDPLRVSNPCVGSGVMLLAHASTYPRWMVELGLVQYYGQDIDPVCVRMARINAMLYGLNGYAIRCAAPSAEAGIFQDAWKEAKVERENAAV